MLGFSLLLSCGAMRLRADEMMRQVQEELRKRHLYFGDVDGRLTPEVSAALQRYQERKGFAATGTADDTTLRSLTLLPPAPADQSFAALPDIMVLRSDAGREGDREPRATLQDAGKEAEAAPARAPEQTPAPPPAAAVAQRPDLETVRAFLERYLQAGQTNDPAGELRFYGDQVDYFEDGTVDQHYIEADVRKFEHRWPERQFSLAGPVEMAGSPDGDPAKTQVRFRYRFTEKSSRYAVTGQADVDYMLAGSRPDELRIVSMKEQRVRPPAAPGPAAR